MTNVNFQDDFDLFRARGRIGLVLSIEVPTDTPEIGSVCPVVFYTCGMPASVRIDEQARFDVSDRQVVGLRILEDRPYRLQLFSEVGEEVTEVTLKPSVLQPEITALTLPVSCSYAESALRGKIRTKNAEHTHILYRPDGEDYHNDGSRWKICQLDLDGNFTLHIDERAHNLIIHFELMSVHAQYNTMRARTIVEKTVCVKDPEPSCSMSHDELFRFETVELRLNFKWLRSLEVIYHKKNIQTHSNQGVHEATIDLETTEVGLQKIDVDLIDLAGVPRKMILSVNILPRQFACAVAQEYDGEMEIILQGANQPWLRLEDGSKSIEVELPDRGGVVGHGFFVPRQMVIVATDDFGRERQTLVHLNPIQHKWKDLEHKWQDLPILSTLHKWRI